MPDQLPADQQPDTGSDTGPDTGFSSLGLGPELVAALTGLGYEEPTPIQREAIPHLLAGRDLLGQAATGTGKTAAFALPLLQRIALGDGNRRAPRALVLVPTRELAMQVSEAVHKYGKGLGVRVLSVYGGAAMVTQLRALDRGVDVVIATPGRALDHVRRKSLVLSDVQVLVLDEADEMLDMGFADDLEAILSAVPRERQTALFSATMAPRVAAIGERHLKNPVRVMIGRETLTAGEMPRVRQMAYIVPRAHKGSTLARVLDMEAPTSAIVFCRTRGDVDELAETLTGRGYRAEALHGGMTQEQRDRVMKKFRAGTVELLVATDVAARGLDIEHLSHVVNYDVPSAPESYVHRIGRTGRAGREGVAITIAEPREHRQLRNIERVTKQRITMGTVPTVADLRARRLDLTRASMREMLLAGDLDQYRVVGETLAGEFDLMDVVAAALRLVRHLHRGGAESEAEIPVAAIPEDRPTSRGAGRFGREGRGERGDRGDARRTGAPPRYDDSPDSARDRQPSRAGRSESPRPRRRKEVPWTVARIYLGAGRKAGIRPGDVVGAIANEVGVDSSAVGAIEIADSFTLVEVPEEIAEDVIQALRGTTLKGKRVPVRRDREQG